MSFNGQSGAMFKAFVMPFITRICVLRRLRACSRRTVCASVGRQAGVVMPDWFCQPTRNRMGVAEM